MKSSQMTTFILIAMLLGIAAGGAIHALFPDAATQKMLAGYVSVGSTVFLRLIEMIIAPLAFSTLVVGIGHMSDAGAVGRVGGEAMLWFVSASLVSLTLGLILVNLFELGTGAHKVATGVASGIDAHAILLRAGKVEAVASDDVLLAGLLASQADGAGCRLAGDVPSLEPYAIAFRRDDPQFAALVQASFARMARGGVLTARCRRWFTDRLPDGQDLGLPMSAQLTEVYRALGQTD